MRILIVTILLYSSLCNAQTHFSKSTTNWKLYDIHRNGSLRYPADTLKNFPYVSMNQDTINIFLKQLTSWPKQQPASWMGAYIASYEANNAIHKVDISVYGGFLYDEQSKQYFELPIMARDDWMAYLNYCFEHMQVK